MSFHLLWKDLTPNTCCNSCVPQERMRVTIMNQFLKHMKNLKKLYRRQKRQQVVCLASNSPSKLKASTIGQDLTNKGIWFTGPTHTSSTCKNKHNKETFMSWASFKKSVHTYSLVCVDWVNSVSVSRSRPETERATLNSNTANHRLCLCRGRRTCNLNCSVLSFGHFRLISHLF